MSDKDMDRGFRLGSLLIVDDEIELLDAIRDTLVERGYTVSAFSSPREALAALERQDFDVLLSDLMMPEMTGIELLQKAVELDPNLVGIIMTGQATVQTAVDAMKIGAFDYVMKPFKLNVLLPVINRALDVRRLKKDNLQLREMVAVYELGQTIGQTWDLNAVLNKVAECALQQVQANESSVMLVTPDGNELFVAAVKGAGREGLLGERIPIEQGVAGWVARNRQPVILDGEVNDPRFAPIKPRPEIQSAICMPLLSGNKLVGVLNANSTESRSRFTLGRSKALSILCNIAASVVEGASLYAEARQAGESLRAAEAKYRGIFENAVEGIFQTTPDGRFVSANPALASIYGYDSPEELMASATDIANQLYVESQRRSEFARLLDEHDEVRTFESEVYRKDGSTMWISENARAVRDASGKLLYYEGRTEDITARKQAQTALRKAEEQYRSIFENAVEGICQITIDGRYLTANPALARMFGYDSAHEFIDNVNAYGYRPGMYVDQRRWPELINTLRREGVVRRFESEVHRRVGSSVWVSENMRSVMDDAGRLLYYEGTVEDVTERKRVEEEVRATNRRLKEALNELQRAQSKIIKQERLHALGTMASGIAHDFNNALGPILGYSELLLMRPENLDDRGKVTRYLQLMNTGAKDAANIVSRLREFYRQRETGEVFLPVNLTQLVKQAVSLTQPKWKDQALAEGKTVNVALELEKVPLIAGNEHELREVLTNLIFNAVDAMPEGGTITIRTSVECQVSSDEKTDSLDTGPPSLVTLSVSDTGTGMTDEVRQRCMDPFFSTKGDKGTGLGLAMVHGIVRRHEGTIDIRSQSGQGTTFAFRFPVQATPAAREGEKPPVASRPLSILIVDDEPGLRETISEYLTGDGHRVETAADGREALQKFNAGRFDLVITDRAMPELSGDQLAAAIKALVPNMLVIMLTGFGDLMRATGEMPEGVDYLLSKPMTLNGLRQAIAKAVPASR